MMRKLKKAIRSWWLCRTKQCLYFTDYLAYGPPELTHEGYHAAERKCEYWQKRDSEYLQAHPNAIDSPFRQQCEVWEKRVRA